MTGRRLYLAKPRGFCAGVDRAVDIVRAAIEQLKPPIYVRHAIVHNERVVEELEELGAIFIEDIIDIAPGSTVIFSAHGVSPMVRREAEALGLHVIDATCPLVAKVHIEVMRYAQAGRHILLVGHRNHVEVIGTLGEAPDDSIRVVETVAEVESLRLSTDQVAFVTQTTLSVDDTAEIVAAIKRRYPDAVSPSKDDICYATQNRQDALKRMATLCQTVIVVSSTESSNGTRLVEVAQAGGMTAYMVQSADQIEASWLTDSVGLTAAASTPDSTVQECVTRIVELGGHTVTELTGPDELMVFPLPAGLQEQPRQHARKRAE